jgi:hypothetical protein
MSKYRTVLQKYVTYVEIQLYAIQYNRLLSGLLLGRRVLFVLGIRKV